MNATASKWIRLALLNLLLVALAGLLLRIKILFPLPWIHHKNLLHAHSHFAFAGWISLFLMSALVGLLPEEKAKKYNRILGLFSISAYGMLLSFPFQGYGAVSIFFSTASVVVGWWFAMVLWKENGLRLAGELILLLSRWSVVFLVLSSFGTFYLAWLMANHINKAELYFGAVYFYLHFQYNGWFLFAVLALLFSRLPVGLQGVLKTPVQLLAWVSIPAYFLSALWMRLPSWMNGAALFAALVQPILVVWLVRILYPVVKASVRSGGLRQIWLLSLLAFCIKVLLQSLSVLPGLSSFAFAYRPVVIGYLHLVLLGFVSLFLLGWMIEKKLLPLIGGRLSNWCWLFIFGIVLTELTLMAQGVSAMFYWAIPHTNELLLLAAGCLFIGILGLNLEAKLWGKRFSFDRLHVQ
ncbi:hypothetical protein [Flavihumibacter sp. CACIAM 22H1]|uniref:hypothetical protein n=1 Tax=Flavihumibacter sp. CACIAM 22H1 TaxID=1812911 RepID=UPI0007A7D92F|nr:hypothetical protein [Flavihumibacter sp. CACIAM 22H1]KYP14504.1 MAG: hypothetical protein A1D16_15365 [Flavihumibacter sp. CACIAM 22H1]